MTFSTIFSRWLILVGLWVALPVSATTLVDENFDDATANAIQAVLASSPATLPAGTLWSSSTTASAVNLRAGTDTINGYNAGNSYQRFSFASGQTFFSPNTADNKFLVLGDDSGQLAGGPDNGSFGFAIPFAVPNDATSITVSFDWVFKAFVLGGTNGSTDRLSVRVVGAGFSINNALAADGISIVDQSIASQGALQGPASATVPVANLGAPDGSGNYYLVFGLLENTGTNPTTNAAVGIDNILVTTDGSGNSGGGPGGGDPGTGGGGGSGTFMLPPASGGNPAFTSAHFSGSANCAMCHDGIRDQNNADVSIITDWSSTMMANSARDPFWRAKVRSELSRHPTLAATINEKCTRCHAPMANTEAKKAGESITIFDGGVLSSSNARHDQALNGVSCTLCHQVQDSVNLGTLSGMSGNYEIGESKTIFGQYANPFTMPMTMHTGFTPAYSSHVTESKLCAACHNLKTPYVDAAGNVLSTTPESEFPEQMPYTEWEHSSYASQKTCQGCHMSQTGGVKISTMPMMLGARNDFGIHEFVGGNTLMLNILKDHAAQLGVLSTNFAETIAKTDTMLKSAAAVTVLNPSWNNGVLDFTLKVDSTTGHKLPTGFPSRRAILHVSVSNAQGQLVWESGKVNADGSVAGVDADSQPAGFEPHYDLITEPGQVQVYEAIMGDHQGNVTYTLLHGAAYLKDNRLLPAGFDKATAPNDVRVVGAALADDDFTGGSDQVGYRISGLAGGAYTVKAELVYQTLAYGFARDLFTDTTTPEVVDFKTLFDASTHKSTVIASTEFGGSLVPNQAPVANAGTGRRVRLGSTVSLDGSSSHDPDGGPQPLAFQWGQTSGPAATLINAGTASPAFVPSASGVYVFGLTVSDSQATSAPHSVAIEVPILGAVDADGDVDNNDLALINAALNTMANGPNDLRDINGDEKINVLDARKLALLCTRPRCAVQ